MPELFLLMHALKNVYTKKALHAKKKKKISAKEVRVPVFFHEGRI